MSFLSDLFEGNFGNLGNDISHTFSSLASHPDQLAETIGAGALIAAPFVVPEIGAAIGIGAGADAALGADTALAADAGLTADAAAGGLGADALAFAPATVDALSISPALGGDVLPFASAAENAALPETSTLATGSIDLGDTAATDAAAAGPQPSILSQGDPLDPSNPANFGNSGKMAAGETAESAGGGGFTQTLKDTLASPYTRLGLAAAPLALTLARGESSLPPQTGPAMANATALAQQGPNLNSAQTATIAQMRQDLINQYKQVLFNQGVQDPSKDTRWPQMLSQIDSQVTAATQTMIQQNITNSLAGDQQLLQIAQMQMTADQNFTNTLMNATKALGTAAGLGSGVTLKVA